MTQTAVSGPSQSASSVNRIVWLDVARTVAILSVALNHAIWAVLPNPSVHFLHRALYASAFSFSRLGVPLFLMITGTLILSKPMNTPKDVERFYKHNLLRLLLTSEIWYAIMFLVIVLPDHSRIEATATIPALIGSFIKNAFFANQITFENMWYIPMILMLYLLMPAAIRINEEASLFKPLILAAMAVTFVISFLLPDISRTASAFGLPFSFSLVLSQGNLFSRFWIYIVIGRWIGNGGMNRVPGILIHLGFVLSVVFLVMYQEIIFTTPSWFLIGYECTFILFCSLFLFEEIRRLFSKRTEPLALFTLLSKTAFGIFFLHIIIVKFFGWFFPQIAATLPGFIWIPLLWIISVAGSVLIIVPLSRISFCKKYLFLIK